LKADSSGSRIAFDNTKPSNWLPMTTPATEPVDIVATKVPSSPEPRSSESLDFARSVTRDQHERYCDEQSVIRLEALHGIKRGGRSP